jgi:iron complex outermembrane recepter protein
MGFRVRVQDLFHSMLILGPTVTRMTSAKTGRSATAWSCARTLAVVVLLAISNFAVAQDSSGPSLSPPDSAKPNGQAKVDEKRLDELLNLAEKDVSRLSDVRVEPAAGTPTTSTSPTDTLSSKDTDFSKATSTGDLLKQLPNVNGRRLSGINIEPRVRGYNSSQMNASANGMTQRRSIQDIDSLLSQIDPGVIQEITVIDGPYTSLYGPGFVFITADLFTSKRYDRPEIHSSTFFNYSSNGQILYGRENLSGGGKDWGVYCSYGVRSGNDYRAGGASSELVPSSFEKWDTMLSVGYDLNPYSRIEFDMLHTDMNNVQMPGIIYDLANSANNQYNIRYIIQEDRDGPQQVLLQSWHQETFFHGDAANESKQRTFYHEFMTLVFPDWQPVNTLCNGYNVSSGARALRTFGRADAPQLTVGVDWRRYEQRYQEYEVDPTGLVVFNGNYYGVPDSSMDDFGVLTNAQLPLNDNLMVSVGGRVDYAETYLDVNDPVITHFDPGAFFFYQPGFNMPNYTLGMAYLNGKYKLNDTDTLQMGTSFAMRPPNLSELYFDEPYVPYCGLGNSAINGLSVLKPEKNWQFDLGVTCERSPLRYGARGFYSTIWDYIMAVPCWDDAPYDSSHVLHRNFSYFPADFRGDLGKPSENGDTIAATYQNTNIGMATLYGFDLFGELAIRRGVSLLGKVSYIHGENLDRVQFVDAGEATALNGKFVSIPGKESLPNIYPLNGRISLRISDPEQDKWGTEFTARLVNSQNEVATSLSELPSLAFSVFDLSGYYRVRKNLRVSLSLENLLNTNYYEPGSVVILNSQGVPSFIREPGFSAILGVDGKF